ncbi:phosphonate transport system substrate-binding protein [Marinobacterium sediminicola]|uniref:Phosphonate transport system substrate-binding protein n=2 Tax=Marinobacterium sediminicola TaxID=518898 RepID=A0ABY1RWU3_9GAMM|nr:putative selenate ABC transporter substrate-binding protein [Marinobacterium sediminicola]ULG70318.1 putative selenate ABC transporter substrate-binding protein [Marinobacterium sediminicola]SMR69744.1 phosphonate transport system substrate-binding protein [Marinobacterium sediminicola]
MSFVRRMMALVLLALPAWAQAESFVFTAIPDADESRLQQRFGKVADYLTEQLGVEVKYIPVKSYAAAITAFRNNQVQLAWFGGLSGVQARRLVPGSEALAQGYEDQFFKSYIIANTRTGLAPSDSLSDALKGKTFTFGSKGSTSGRLMPEFYLREHFGAAPEAIFGRVGFSGDHSRTIAQVQAGAYEVGAVNYAVWEKELEEGKIDPSKVTVIWTTPTYPDYQWTVRGDVDAHFGAGFKEKVRAALLEMKAPDLLASFPRQSFVPASNDDYGPIEATARAIGLLDD